MADLTSTEKQKLEKILEMGGGYVLDFSNRSFREFVEENTGIDIYSEGFENYGTSKANRLRSYWNQKDNILTGQLLKALLERRRVNKLLNEEFTTINEQTLLEECEKIAQRLLNNQVNKNYVETKLEDKSKSNELRLLFSMFEELSVANNPQRRGYLLQDLLSQLFLIHEIAVSGSFQRNNGAEQIDGAFSYRGWYYFIECKWTKNRAEPKELDSLLAKVNRGGRQVMGLFISIEGWSENVVPLLKQNPNKCIILMDGYDLRCILTEAIELERLLDKKFEHLNKNSEPFLSAVKILYDNS